MHLICIGDLESKVSLDEIYGKAAPTDQERVEFANRET
jgi:hypothetical protein